MVPFIEKKQTFTTPSFLLAEIRSLQKFVKKEEALNDALTRYCGNKCTICNTTLVVIEAIALMILPMVGDIYLARKEADLLVLHSNWGTYRDDEGNPIMIVENNATYRISSIVGWIKYIYWYYYKKVSQTV